MVELNGGYEKVMTTFRDLEMKFRSKTKQLDALLKNSKTHYGKN